MADTENPLNDSSLPKLDPDQPEFTPAVLDKTIIAIPLLKQMKEEPDPHDVIIDLNLRFVGGIPEAKERVKKMIKELMGGTKTEDLPPGKKIRIHEVKTNISSQYVFATLTADIIRKLTIMDNPPEKRDNTNDKNKWQRAIYRIWPDFDVKAFTSKSISTVKADAARSSFSAFGQGITWAIVDSGIDRNHIHFQEHQNIHDLFHKDFTAHTEIEENPFNDESGHGTHVAGIIAGEIKEEKEPKPEKKINAIVRHRDEMGNVVYEKIELKGISGMAPKCKLISLKVLGGAKNEGKASNLIVAIEYIQQKNAYGRDIKIHGVNMSLGYDFDPEWFACGQSPLCVEVNRLVKSGVVVVAAAGNTGYGFVRSAARNVVATGLPLSINDPGNAELAITVGSTHRDMPHTYGVSYFSSKGPTGDGRLKPDIVAPGEKIISCAAGNSKRTAEDQLKTEGGSDYVENSGTSMAAPHVSGVIAAFLSIRNEYIGNPESVKQIFLSTATDLKRDRYFQGHGLIDLMRAIQSV